MRHKAVVGIEYLLLRYGTSQEGEIVKKAHIYLRQEHGIDPGSVDADAVWVVRRLRKEGFHAYIVGGAVRDMLLGRKPKDFDVATDAFPQRIRRIFRSSRIIGKRFRIVHVYAGRDKFLEVTTFRSNKAAESTNLFGTMEEDAQRRDFTFNALYYCPVDEQIIDYVEGFPDIRHKHLRTLIPAETSFAEDPVRMIRAVKYASITGFPIPMGMAGLIKRMRESLLECSRERVTEEVYKILTSGCAAEILEISHRLKLFDSLFPALSEFIKDAYKKFSDSPLYKRAQSLDSLLQEGQPLERERMFVFLFRDLTLARKDIFHDSDPAFLLQQLIKSVSFPLFPSKRDLGVAAHELLREFRHAAGKQFPRAAHRFTARSPGEHKRRVAEGGQHHARPLQ